VKLVTTEQMRELDRQTIHERGIPGRVLMERAGLGVAEVVRRVARLSGCQAPRVRLFAGKGNNGGDAFVAARVVHEWGMDAELWLAGEAETVQGDALHHLDRMKAAGVPLQELPSGEGWKEVPVGRPGERAVLVDGILGTGVHGAARDPAAAAIRCVNGLGRRHPVIAIDMPSGLNTDTGEAEGETVIADITVTMAFPKCGLVEPRAADYVGRLEVVDIGIPDELVGETQGDRELICASDLRGGTARRERTSHKGSFGHVLIVGGATGYAGAPALAARAALRSGVGLVTGLVPSRIAPVVAGMVPEAMIHGGAETETGSLALKGLEGWHRDLSDFEAVLMGPGMTPHEQTQLLVERVLAESPVPVVLDADALNVCAGRPELISRANNPVVITPHPGELGRILQCSAREIQADRPGSVRRALEETRAIVILKGAGSLVGAEGQALQINMTGNPGMATGGMGDVLGGVVAGLLAQGLTPFDAARQGVYVHGDAGDNVAWRRSQAGMVAGDVIEELPNVLRELAGR